MRQLFHTLPVGQEFIEKTGENQFVIYRKTTKSKATAVKQVGYGNTRMVGGTFLFASFSNVCPTEGNPTQ